MLRNASAGHGYWMTSARILREQRTRMLDSAGSRELAGPTEACVRSLRLEVGEGCRVTGFLMGTFRVCAVVNADGSIAVTQRFAGHAGVSVRE
jgi:hypothetical protein